MKLYSRYSSQIERLYDACSNVLAFNSERSLTVGDFLTFLSVLADVRDDLVNYDVGCYFIKK